MSGRKKKNKQIKVKFLCIFLIVLLFMLTLLLELVLVKQIVRVDKFYSIENRKEKIKESKKEDDEGHETIGWVRVQGTNIDYPVYGVLNRLFSYPVNSDSYTWSLSYDSKYHDLMMIYGHNILNLSSNPKMSDKNFNRMEELMRFLYYDFVKENKYIQLSMDGKNQLYKIFSVSFMKVNELNAYPTGGLDSNSRKDYLEKVNDNSIYNFDIDVSESDEILSVVTCTRFFDNKENYDFIVTGRKVRENEKIENYKVYRNRNYEKIEEIMKGED